MTPEQLAEIEWQEEHLVGTDYHGTAAMLRELMAEVLRLQAEVASLRNVGESCSQIAEAEADLWRNAERPKAEREAGVTACECVAVTIRAAMKEAEA